MRNKLLSLVFVLAIGLSAFAQTSLKGRVIDEATQNPIVGARITLANQNISTTTNAAGEFTLLYLEAMDEEVVIEADGYVAALELVNLQDNQTNQMEAVAMQQDIVSHRLPPLRLPPMYSTPALHSPGPQRVTATVVTSRRWRITTSRV